MWLILTLWPMALLFAQNPKTDSLTLLLKTATHDTSRCNLLSVIIETETDEKIWAVYSQQLKTIAEKHLKSNNEPFRSFYLNHYALTLRCLGQMAALKGNDSVLNYYTSSLDNFKKAGNLKSAALLCNMICEHYYQKNNTLKAIEYSLKELQIREKIGSKKEISETLHNISTIYHNQGDVSRALEYSHRALKIREEMGDKKGISKSLNNLAIMYFNQGDTDKALEYHMKSLKLREELSDKQGVHQSLNNIGVLYNKLGYIDKALYYYQKALKIREELDDQLGIAESMHNIGVILKKQGNIDGALNLFKKSLKIRKEMQDSWGISGSLNNLAKTYFTLGITQKNSARKKRNYSLALAYGDSCFAAAKELGYPEHLRNAEEILSQIDSANGNFKGAFTHYKNFIIYRDSIVNEQTRKAGIKNQLKYEFDKKEAILKEQQEKERAISLEKSRFQQIVILSVAIGLFLVIAFAVYIFRSLNITRKQKIVIEEKQKEILDSIHYAQRIQRSLLPNESYIHKKINYLQTNR